MRLSFPPVNRNPLPCRSRSRISHKHAILLFLVFAFAFAIFAHLLWFLLPVGIMCAVYVPALWLSLISIFSGVFP